MTRWTSSGRCTLLLLAGGCNAPVLLRYTGMGINEGIIVDVTTATAPEIDHRYVELMKIEARASQALGIAYNRVHDGLGERRGPSHYEGRRFVSGEWPTLDEEVVKLAEATLVDDSAPEWRVGHVRRVLGELASASAAVVEARAAFAPLDAEWDRRGGWSRFFIVQNNNGHIHSNMHCSTCYVRTQFGWLPDLSGLTEADAVEAHGTILCSVCFPSAPVEWTVGRQAPTGCAGSGMAPAGATDRVGMRTYGECSVCHTRQLVTGSGIRKHKP